MQKLAGVIGVADPFEMYMCLISHLNSSRPLVLGTSASGGSVVQSDWLKSLSIEEQMIFLDTANYLTDDMLVKIDRAAMSVSLETRIPFLDHRLIEFAWRLPLSWKIRGGKGKWILRRLLAKYLSPSLFDRPKSGFAIPLADWLRGPLRDWAESLLAEERLKREAFFDGQAIRQNWANFLKRGQNLQFHIWDVLMFQSWLESNLKSESLETGVALAGEVH
jgi:asparagine synthase (glutamine-hydrolysing)